MRRTVTPIMLSAALCGASVAQAGHPSRGADGGFYDYAEVVRVEPIVRPVRVSQPREECWEEEMPVRSSEYRSATPMILGGILGGVVGSTMGKGDGRTAATVAGTVLGGSLGRDVGQAHRRDAAVATAVETRCRRVADYREEERIEGYDVTYRYRDAQYTTRMPRGPGPRLRVHVDVRPAW